MNSKRTIRRVLAVVAFATVTAALRFDVSAQNLSPPGAYQPIPKLEGVGAGLQFREAIDDRFSGLRPLSPAMINGQTDGALAAPKFSGTTVLASATVSGGSSIGASASRRSRDINGVYNVQNYGAKGDGVRDDSAAEQAAIDAGCAAANGAPFTVYWPTPVNFYLTETPLFIHCSKAKLQGPGIANSNNPIIQQTNPFGGPAFVFQQYNMPGVMLGAPLISGSTHSASFSGITHSYYINLCDLQGVCWSTSSSGLNGARAATIDAYVKLAATTAGNIVCSNGSDAGSSTTYAYCLGINGRAQFFAYMTINGTTYTLTDTTTRIVKNANPALATLYNEQLTYDGTTIRLFTNGTQEASSSHSGTITQPYYETVTVGGGAFPNKFPESNADNINGLIDGVQISNVARHTSNFTPCSCEPTIDRNTLGVASFDQNLHMLTQLTSGTTGRTTWSFVRDFGGSGVGGIEMDGISYLGRQGVGVIGQNFQGVHIHHSTFVGVLHGIYEYSTDFENTFDDDYISCGSICFYAGGQSGLQFLTGGIQLVGGIVGLRSIGNSIVAEGVIVQSQTSNIWNYDIEGDTGDAYFDCTGCGADVENCGANYRGGLDLYDVETTSWNGGAIAACPATPVAEIDGGTFSGDSAFVGVNWGPTSNSPEIINMVNSPAGEAKVIAPFTEQKIQWSNSPANVSVEPCKGNVTLSSGSAYFSNICLTNGVPKCVDTTTGTNTVACGPISAGRQVTDGVTASNTTVTSATAHFVAGDVARKIEGGNIPANTTIRAVGSSTSITISHAALASGRGVTLTLDGLVPITGTGSDVIRINAE